MDLSFPSDNNETVVMNSVNCTGGEKSLTACPFDRNGGNCLHDFYRVGVQCHEESKYIHVATMVFSYLLHKA